MHYNQPPKYLPTPDEIKQATNEIRKTWTPRTHDARWVGERRPRTSIEVVDASVFGLPGFDLDRVI